MMKPALRNPVRFISFLDDLQLRPELCRARTHAARLAVPDGCVQGDDRAIYFRIRSSIRRSAASSCFRSF